MKWFIWVLLLAIPAATISAPPRIRLRQKDPAPQAQPAPVAIIGVTVIDCTGAAPRPDQTVLITGNRITQIGKTGQIEIPKEATVIPAKGKYLIPGLWDMHAHVESQAFLPLFLGNGVTGVRHMFTGSPLQPPVMQWRKEVENGRRIGPHLVVTTRVLDGLNGEQPVVPGSAIAVTTPQEARDAVDRIRRDGEDFIKIYPFLKPDVFAAVLDQAARGARKIPVSGHVPHVISAADASDQGMKSMEHLYGVLLCCSSDEEKLRKQLVGNMTNGAMVQDTLDAAGAWRVQVKALDSYDEKKAEALFRKFVKNETWFVPTLVCRRTWALLTDSDFTTDPRKKYMPVTIIATWFQTYKGGTVRLPLFGGIELTPRDIENQKLLYEGHQKLVLAMHKAGVKLLAGTDTPVPYCFPGSGLHDELELLVKAGLTPAAALQTATRNPAEYLDRLKDVGTIEVGKLADLVLLDANPLVDIRNTRTIHAVILGGKHYPKAVAEAMAQSRKP